MNLVAPAVPEDLELHVPRFFDEFLQVHRAVAEGAPGLAPGALASVENILRILDQAHALAAAPEGGLDHQRVAHLGGDIPHLICRKHPALIRLGQQGPRHHRHAGLFP